MLIDVQAPIANLILNSCFYLIALVTLLAIVPWTLLGFPRAGRHARWVLIPTVVLAVIYESAMPSRFDIRLDLLLLLPAYALVFITSVARWMTQIRNRSTPN